MVNHRRKTLRPTAARLLLLPLAIALIAGCGETTGLITQAFTGPPKIDARYEPDDRATVVFVDDPAHRLPGIDLPGLIAGRVGDRLEREAEIQRIISPTRIDRLQADESEFASWPIDRVGREVDAEQVLYILVTGFELTESDAIYRPTATVRIKWVDAASGQRFWPSRADHPDGYPLTTQQEYRNMQGASAMTESIIGRELAEALAGDVAKLFYKHRARDVGER